MSRRWEPAKKVPLQSDVFMWNAELERLARPDLESLQLQRLKKTVELAAVGNAFYKERLRESGITAANLKSVQDVVRLPITSKSDLRDHYPYGFFVIETAKLARIHASSGTRGKPTIAGYTQNDIAVWADLCARSLTAAGARAGQIIHNAYGYGLFTGGLGMHYGGERLGATVVPASGGRTQQQLLLLRDLGSHVLCCTPSYALNLALSLEESDMSLSDLSLKVGVFGAEPWTEECRSQLEERLGITAVDIYGLSEVMGPGVAAECEQGKSGLHIWEDHFLAEILHPETLEPVADGEEGELVITTLTKEAQPLLRYRTGDRARFLPEACRCTRTHRRVSRMIGRLDEMIIVRGVNVYPTEIESLICTVPDLAPHYQVVLSRDKALDDITVRVELASASNQGQADLQAIVNVLSNQFKDRFGLSALIEILPPGSLPRSEGKATRVVDLRTLA